MASSCTGLEYLVEQLPRIRRLFCRHLLNGITDVDENMITRCELFSLQKEQADFAFDTARSATTLKAINRFDLHRYGKTHDLPSIVGAPTEVL